jgi:bifunctional UDP-N-acetylglucosamine pyrophosphorylase/glucosamine-1-phosphate N-acetyltransferase
MTGKLACVILAAGQSKRMKTRRSKALHPICGAPLLARVLRTIRELNASPIVTVISPDADEVAALAHANGSETVVQDPPLGTGHATLQARGVLGGFEGTVLLTCVDIPLLRVETLQALIDHHLETRAAATILTAEYDDPTGYGRIVRGDDGGVQAIVEHRDADELVLAIREINSSVYCFRSPLLFELAASLSADNDQGEQYLTDVIADMVAAGERVEAVIADDPQEIAGINNRVQLAEAERALRNRIRERLMLDGVTLIDPETTYVDDGVQIGRDTTIWPCTFILGQSRIGEGCEIGPHATVRDCEIGDGVLVRHGTFMNDSLVGDEATIGPFAHIRSGCAIGRKARAGSYVEMKAAELGEGVKAGHVSYLGDVTVGAGSNIGAGAITCNYDGARKHKTIIGERAFIGSNVSLVAPVTIGDGAYVGAGSTITTDGPPGTLAVERSKQREIEGWKPPRKDDADK